MRRLIRWAHISEGTFSHAADELFVLRFYSPVNPMGSCWSVYLTTLLVSRQLSFLDQRKGENDRRKYFIIKSPRKNVVDPVGIEPATSLSPVGRGFNWATEAGHTDEERIFLCSGWMTKIVYVNERQIFLSSDPRHEQFCLWGIGQ